MTFSPNFFHVFQEEESSLEDETCGCCKWPSLIDYDQELIPPEPNFFTAGFFWEKQDRSVIFCFILCNGAKKFHEVAFESNYSNFKCDFRLASVLFTYLDQKQVLS